MNYRYYINIAGEVAKLSKCLSIQIGVVLVTPDKTIVGTGYNGPPRGVPHCNDMERLSWVVNHLQENRIGDIKNYILENGWGEKCPRRILGFKSGEGLWICPAAHAERNAIVNSAREGIKTKGSYLFMNCPLPCQECCKEIINAGISRVICYEGPDYDIGSRWLLTKGGVEITQLHRE